MSEILSSAAFLIVLVVAFAALVVWVRRDVFTSPAAPHLLDDGSPQPILTQETADLRRARFTSQATTATA